MSINGFVALCLIGLHTIYTILCLIRNIIVAKTIGFPVVWSPISPFNPFWIIFNKRVASFLQCLPLGLGDWTTYNALDWTWADRTHGNSQVHDKHGNTFVHATPGEIEIHTRDPAVAIQVLRKQANDFPKISHYASKCPLFRRIRTNRLVWAESVRQTQQMIHYYHRTSQSLICDPVEDVRELYLHVFTSVCFGFTYDFKQPERDCIPKGHERSYKDCLHTSLKDILILGYFMVKRNRDLEVETRLGGSKDDGSHALLKESEIRGNLFTYSLGGHESSAHTLTFAIYLLAALSEQQTWLMEEIDQVLGGRPDWKSEDAFMEIFPRLKRCQAAMNETLRLYPSVTVLPKCTGSKATTLIVGSEYHRIPANTNVFVNMPSIQWIMTSDRMKGLDGEQLKALPDGAFLP
ncbi:cytochrome P450 [Colletotrichum fioriniae PJ7]|uniref:Cytochrome P450 n=1 Tax=Colletotrichum fioriniae PJ7 TaxID=1445577 RepID=A0A010QUJ2_9PEZI|nr:cytochrome P450 [Colletotrichum fioriniae PJ7]